MPSNTTLSFIILLIFAVSVQNYEFPSKEEIEDDYYYYWYDDGQLLNSNEISTTGLRGNGNLNGQCPGGYKYDEYAKKCRLIATAGDYEYGLRIARKLSNAITGPRRPTTNVLIGSRRPTTNAIIRSTNCPKGMVYDFPARKCRNFLTIASYEYDA